MCTDWRKTGTRRHFIHWTAHRPIRDVAASRADALVRCVGGLHLLPFSSFSQLNHSNTQTNKHSFPETLRPDDMADLHDRIRHSAAWKPSTFDLDEVIADMSTFLQTKTCLVTAIAKSFLARPSSSCRRGNNYQSAMLHVLAARGYTLMKSDFMRAKALDNIRLAKDYLETFKQASSSVALGMPEHHQVSKLATMIEELER